MAGEVSLGVPVYSGHCFLGDPAFSSSLVAGLHIKSAEITLYHVPASPIFFKLMFSCDQHTFIEMTVPKYLEENLQGTGELGLPRGFSLLRTLKFQGSRAPGF